MPQPPRRGPTPARRGGALITLEGGEGSGKSTQAEALCRLLMAEGYTVIVTREPGGTDLGRLVKGIFEQAEGGPRRVSAGQRMTSRGGPKLPAVTPLAELLLFEAARAQHLAQVIRPALERGDIVLCDRFIDSTLAYQGYGRGLSLDDVRAANRIASGGLLPNLTLLLDLPAQAGLARADARPSGRKNYETVRDSIGQESLEFHRRVRRGFLELARQEPERIIVLDGTQPPGEVTRIAWEHLEALLARLA